MNNAVAFSDNDVAVVAWSYGRRLEDCLGFAVYRIEEGGKETPLPAMAVFKGTRAKPGQTTEDCPVQKFYWKDVYARRIADKTGHRKFRYKVVPMEGKPGALRPMKDAVALVTNVVEVTPHLSPSVEAYFNRGIISTQHVAKALGGGKPSKGKLLDRVADPKDRLRADLAGDMVQALAGFVQQAKKSGTLHAALYELGDDELIGNLCAVGKRAHVVLSNPKASDKESHGKGGTSDAQSVQAKAAKAVAGDGNHASRGALKKAGVEVFDRMLPSNQIGHNKFVVYSDKTGPQAVLFGSTNWTSTGLCTQTNNTVICRDPVVARRYLQYWGRLRDDTKQAGKNPKALQGTALRTWDAKSSTLALDDASLTSWFSPNTPALRSTGKKKQASPPDMKQLEALMMGAKQAILFLAFYPGRPSIANWAANSLKANKSLFVRGAVTNPDAAADFLTELQGQQPPKKAKGAPARAQDPRVVQDMALTKVIPKGWQQEILNAGFAVTHDKIVVIDPFSDDCVVATGSHNLGYKASFNNDENLVIVRGHRALAEAYATHVLDIYDHFSWRWQVQKGKLKDATLATDDGWQSRYIDDKGRIVNQQLRFWLSATPSPTPELAQGKPARKTAPAKGAAAKTAASRRKPAARKPAAKRASRRVALRKAA